MRITIAIEARYSILNRTRLWSIGTFCALTHSRSLYSHNWLWLIHTPKNRYEKPIKMEVKNELRMCRWKAVRSTIINRESIHRWLICIHVQGNKHLFLMWLLSGKLLYYHALQFPLPRIDPYSKVNAFWWVDQEGVLLSSEIKGK